MNFKRFTLFLSISIAIGVLYLNSNFPVEGKYRSLDHAESKFSSANGYLEYIHMLKANQHTGEIDYSDVVAGLKQANKLSKAKSNLNISWTFKGPDNIGGRTRALIIDRNDRNHILAGAVAGGVFESFNAGQDWNVYDDTYSVKNISCITQATDGSFYVGTGGHFENIPQTREAKGYFFAGSGLWKLDGNGGYEAIVQPDNRIDLNTPWATIGQVVADPANSNILYVAMNRGFRKIDLSTNPYTITDPIGSSIKANDVDVTIDGKVIVTFDDGSIHVSHDNAQQFARIPFNGAGRIEVAIAPSNNNIMYAAMGRASNNCLYGVYRSRDGGATWLPISPGSSTNFDMMSNTVPCTGGATGQADWDNMVAVHPDDPGLVFVGGVTLYRWEQSSVDPATPNGSWDQIDIISSLFSLPGQARPSAYLHADKHRMVFDPSNSNIAYIATDGGIYKSFNIASTSPSYRAYNFDYKATQFYDIGAGPLDLVIGGTQDNGSIITGMEFNNNLGGYNTLTGDGFDAEMSFINPSLAFASSQFNGFTRIQGIAKKAGNSNISRADIVGANPLLAGFCSSGCSDVFYSTSRLWESFDHKGSKDIVADVLIDRTPPPMKDGRTLSFESNNSSPERNLIFNEIVKEIPFYDSLPNNGKPGMNYSLGADSVWRIYPADTLYGDNKITEVVINKALDTLVFNYDILYVDTVQKTVTIVHPNLAMEIFNFSIGSTQFYANEYIDNDPIITDRASFVVKRNIVNGAPQLSISVRDIQISFAYDLKFIDPVQSMFMAANWPGRSRDERNVWMTRDLMKNSPQIIWFSVAGENSGPDKINRGEDVITIEMTKDGNVAFFGTRNGRLLRLSGLNTLTDDFPFTESANLYSYQSDTVFHDGDTALLILQEVANFDNRAITGIAISDYDANYIAVSLGNYGNDDFVYVIDNALYKVDLAAQNRTFLDTTSFSFKNVDSLSTLRDTVLDTLNLTPIQMDSLRSDSLAKFELLNILQDTNNIDSIFVISDSVITERFPYAFNLKSEINTYSIQGFTNNVLPKVPAYDVEFDVLDSVVPPTRLYLGNELGFYVTENPFGGTVIVDSTNIPSDSIVITRDTVLAFIPAIHILVDSIITPDDSVVFNDTTVYRTPGFTSYIIDYITPVVVPLPGDTSVRIGTDAQWTEEVVGMGRVPVFSIEQNKFDWNYSLFYSKLYVGTHGRGVFETGQLVGLPDAEHNVYKDGFKSSVSMYPNPTKNTTFIEFNLSQVQNVSIDIFDIRGQLVKQEFVSNTKVGFNKVQLNTSELVNGTFIMRIRSGNEVATQKFVVHK